MDKTVITINHISKSFGAIRAVNNLSFEVQFQSCFALLGPNGAGKTTMMKMIYGRARRDKDCTGTMDIFGFNPARQELAIKNLSGVVPQEDNLDEELNLVQNLLIYSKFYGLDTKVARRRIEELLGFLELSDKAKSKIRELSGGMKRRLVIARALMNNPKLLILDEPTTGLDPQVRHLIWDKLRQLKKQGTTILLTTHYMEEAFQLCDMVLIMHQGKKVLEDSPDNLLKDNIEKYVLELTDVDSYRIMQEQNLPESVRLDCSQAICRLYSDNHDQLNTIAAGISKGQYQFRQSNLEDVFLKATGRMLNDRQ